MPVFGSALPYITFYPAIMLSAWYGGFWPGAVMTVLGALTAVSLWPVGSRASAISLVSLALYMFNGLAISGLTEFLHRARRRQAEFRRAEAAHQLEIERLLSREQEARAAAEAATRAKDGFLATLSHELRTPLAAIIGWVSVLRQHHLDEAQLGRAIEIIGRNAQIQARLVNDLLDVSRIVAGKLTLDKHEVDLVALIEETIEGVQQDAAAKDLKLFTRLDMAAGWVLGDSVRLRQVVGNLLSNAVKFTPRGGRIDVELERHRANARLVVRDTGEGMTPEDLPRIFGRFEQAAMPASRPQGLGLGLAICHYLVGLHGGTIHAASAGRGHGATFTVEVPILAVRGQHEPRPLPGQVGVRPATPEAAPRLDGVRVLVVDDHPDARETIGLVLQHCGADVCLAGSVPEARQMLSAGRVDVLVSDLDMPEADGYELIRGVRAAERADRTPALAAVALTAYGSREDRERALAAGFQAHVVKPIDPVELGWVIAGLQISAR